MEIARINVPNLAYRYLPVKLRKSLISFRGTTTCAGGTTEGLGKLVTAFHNICMPTLQELRNDAAIDTLGAVDVKECWILKNGVEIVDLVTDYDKIIPEPSQRRFETLDFVITCGSVPTF